MKTKRDVSVEIIRILACFFVVSIHCVEDIISQINFTKIENLFLMLILSGVTLFWMITGFFIFNNNYKQLVKRTFNNIWLPCFIISIICILGYDYYLFITTGQNMLSPFAYIISIVRNSLSFRVFAPSCKHFWFINTYCLVVLIFPVLKSFVNYLDEDIKRQKVFIIISLTFILINEFTLNEFANIENYGFSAVVMASIEVIYGHLIYDNKDRLLFLGKNIYKYLIVLFTVIFLRSLLYSILQTNNLSLKVLTSWYSIFGIISSYLLITIILNYRIDNSIISNLVINVGKLTFYIFIFHKVPIKILRKIGVENLIISSGPLVKVPLIIVYAIICFIISLFISFCVNKIVGLIKHN